MNKQEQMYQASDGKWYPISHMPQGWQQQPQYGQPQYGYGAQPQMQYQQQPPIIVQQQRPSGGGAGAGMGCLAALCGALLCFDLGACLF